MEWTKEQMADEVIGLLWDGCSVNLGIGMPTLIAERIPENKNVFIHSENGVMGVSGRPTAASLSPTLINAGKESISVRKGASFFDSAFSFGIIRGGHIDFCVMGGMEVDALGNLANWKIPGKKVAGMGGAMDLVHGAKTLIVMQAHFSKNGKAKLVDKCTLPLTGCNVVDLVVTEMGLFAPGGGKFRIKKLAPGIDVEALKISSSLLEIV